MSKMASVKVDPMQTKAAVAAVREWIVDPEGVDKPDRGLIAEAVRLTAHTLAQEAPGHAVEVRIPPFVAVQCISGPRHTRGTPPNVIELGALEWLQLVIGQTSFEKELLSGTMNASGTRVAEVAHWLPLL